MLRPEGSDDGYRGEGLLSARTKPPRSRVWALLALGAAVIAALTGYAVVNGDAIGIGLGIALLANFGWFALYQRGRDRSTTDVRGRRKRR